MNIYSQFLLALPLSLTTWFGTPLLQENLLATHEMSLENRYGNKSVNDVMKFNILHTLDLQGWEFTLQPNQTYAFHDTVDQKYKDTLVKTTNAHFNASEGFKSDGYLVGDGVCHLASLIYWVAKDAGLSAVAPAKHDFMAIPDIAKENGVSIYSYTRQNLYITNNFEEPITFKFEYTDQKVKVSVITYP